MSFICPHCREIQLRTGLRAGEKVRCEVCQQWFVAEEPGAAEEDLELENPAEASGKLLQEVRKILSGIPKNTKYRIGGEIASGGMGRILEAEDPYIRRKIAIKILQDKQSDEEKARFLEEAQLTGQLEHPNIVPLHDLGFTEDGKLFFLMKRVRGKSLEEVLDAIRLGDAHSRTTFTLPRLLQILEQVCSAIAYAHARGVIHRDLKPANIMLGDFGEVLVMDWGLAKAGSVRHRPTPQLFGQETQPRRSTRYVAGVTGYREALRASHEPQPLPEVDLSRAVGIMRNDSNIWGTRKGTIAGTPAYMSPEQARGELDLLDERSDIYSLGAILYEILTGTPPIIGDTESGIVNAVIEHNVPSPRVRAPGRRLPDELCRIAMKALAAAPENRYQSVLDFQGDLRAFLDGVTVYRREDNFWETVFRLVNHYKTATFFSMLIFTTVIAGSVYIYQDLQVAKATLEAARANKEKEKLRAPLEFNAANFCLEQNKPAEARQHLALALTYDPSYRPARLKNAELLLLDQKYEEALAEVQILLKSDPTDTDALRISGQCHKGINELEKPVRQPDNLPLPEAD